jgi:lipopolysaccharide biosynthesis glycosyltransferase
MNNIIPIFFTIDENYAPYLSVAIASLVDHANTKDKYVIHVVEHGIDSESKKKLKTLEKDNIEIKFNDITDKIKPIEDKLKHQSSKTHFPISVYFRLFLPVLFPEYDKGIYIDSDTVLNADIAEFYKIDLEDKLLGGAYDSSILGTPFYTYLRDVIGSPEYEYINSGVLLMNMKKIREIEFENHFLYILNKYDFEVVAPDQDYINAMFKGSIKYLDLVWNAMPVEGKKVVDNPKLIHYNLFFKPWHYKDVDYSEFFWKYADKSLFKDRIVAELDSFTDENKKNDQLVLAEMFKQAKRIEGNKVTFKSIFESGIEKRL